MATSSHLPLVKYFFKFVTSSIADEFSSEFCFLIKKKILFYEKVRLPFLCGTGNLKESPNHSKKVLKNGSTVGPIG